MGYNRITTRSLLQVCRRPRADYITLDWGFGVGLVTLKGRKGMSSKNRHALAPQVGSFAWWFFWGFPSSSACRSVLRLLLRVGSSCSVLSVLLSLRSAPSRRSVLAPHLLVTFTSRYLIVSATPGFGKHAVHHSYLGGMPGGCLHAANGVKTAWQTLTASRAVPR